MYLPYCLVSTYVCIIFKICCTAAPTRADAVRSEFGQLGDVRAPAGSSFERVLTVDLGLFCRFVDIDIDSSASLQLRTFPKRQWVRK